MKIDHTPLNALFQLLNLSSSVLNKMETNTFFCVVVLVTVKGSLLPHCVCVCERVRGFWVSADVSRAPTPHPPGGDCSTLRPHRADTLRAGTNSVVLRSYCSSVRCKVEEQMKSKPVHFLKLFSDPAMQTAIQDLESLAKR